ncbi:MAG: metal-dependent hydrolase [Mariniblastus sp.]
MIKLTWLGHASWLIEVDDCKVLLDPFLNDSPVAPIKASEAEADFILVSHGHFDHVADVVEIANRTDAMVVAVYEIAQWFAEKHSVKNTTGMNIGGSFSLPFGNVKMTQAIHSSQLPDGSYGGVAGGFVLTIGDAETESSKRIYFACDTSLFSDMKLIGDNIDLAVLPIGDLFTMGPEDSVTAARFVNAKQVLPSHYNTWPPIEQDAIKWAELVRSGSQSEPIVLQPGESHEIN